VKIARADVVPWDANLLPAYGSFTELEEACAGFCVRVNGRVHRETAAVPAARLAAEREMLHRLPDEPHALALGEERLGLHLKGADRVHMEPCPHPVKITKVSQPHKIPPHPCCSG
jgi:hypothetical protein